MRKLVFSAAALFLMATAVPINAQAVATKAKSKIAYEPSKPIPTDPM